MILMTKIYVFFIQLKFLLESLIFAHGSKIFLGKKKAIFKVGVK